LLYLSTVSQPTGVFISAFPSFGCFLYTVFIRVCEYQNGGC